MNMQELKKLIYKGEKVDIECKKAVCPNLHMSHTLHLLIRTVDILYLV